MIKDIFITPQVFSKVILVNEQKSEIILRLIDSAKNNLYLSCINEEWIKIVKQHIYTLDIDNNNLEKKILANLKNKLNTILINELDKNTFTTLCSYNVNNPENEENWINAIKEIEEERNKKFDFILTSKEFDGTTIINIENSFDLLKCPTGKNIIQNEENFRKECKNILYHSSQVRLYDPYFDILNSYKRNSEPYYRFKRSLDIIVKELNLGKKNNAGTIKIHTLVDKKYLDKYDFKKFYSNVTKNDFDKYIKSLIKKLNEINYKHTINIYFWTADITTRFNFHDRYISTDRHCIQVGNGLDITFKDSSWSIIGGIRKMKLEKIFPDSRNNNEKSDNYELIKHISVSHKEISSEESIDKLKEKWK